jgi:hypothetical protein
MDMSELKAACRSAPVNPNGVKSQLVERLVKHYTPAVKEEVYEVRQL